jgi:serpin B
VVLLAAVVGGFRWTWAHGVSGATAEGDAAAVVRGNTDFALELYARVREKPGNLFLSPYSISTALAMTFAGARGETARQMADVLHFALPSERLHPASSTLASALRAANDGSNGSFHVASALWGPKGHYFLEEFLALTKEHYGAALRQVDFAYAAEQARRVINEWVGGETQHKIRELLEQGDLDAATVLVLTNAICFKGDWASRFNRAETRDGPFRVDRDKQVVVPMMHQLRQFPFAGTAELDVLELPYVGDRLSMVLLLPKKVDGLAALEVSLSKENLDRWLGHLRQQPVRVRLPRFTLDTRFKLGETLQAMGMNDAFDGRKADFSGMTGRRDLWIDKVVHQARVDVNEEGTEASAATAVVMKKGPPIPEFTADHPFLFFIRDRQSGSILFLGRAVNPRE